MNLSQINSWEQAREVSPLIMCSFLRLPIGSDVLIGDILVLLGASLYAVSNVCEEYIVKKLSRQEFLGMVGLFGTLISGIQL